jgi:hypothetical protein
MSENRCNTEAGKWLGDPRHANLLPRRGFSGLPSIDGAPQKYGKLVQCRLNLPSTLNQFLGGLFN